MKKVKLYYNNFEVDMELQETEYIKLMKRWSDYSNRGGNLTLTTRFNSQYDIDLTLVQLIKTEN